MYLNGKIGVGIITCNRKEQYTKLLNQIKNISYIDCVITVKNKDFDYAQNDPSLICSSDNFYFKHIKEDLGVGFCKNECLKFLLNNNCDHIFLIEDDINIKNNDVFKIYIDTAKTYNLQHLNFNMAWDSITKKYLLPSYTISHPSGINLSIFSRLCGDFEYFTKDVIQQVGLFDAKNYINALEHAEHTYRIASRGYTTPFQAYADVYNSINYIEDCGITSSIQRNEELYYKRLTYACNHFKNTYGRSISQIHIPSIEEIKNFLIQKGQELK